MADKQDVTGVWYGRYAGFFYGSDNSFIAVLEETGGSFGGTITEPDDSGIADIRRAYVLGGRTGSAVRFSKQYDGGSGWDHEILYAGTIDAEGTVISGRWNHEGFGAGFTMQREKFSAAELEAEEEAELEVPVR
ncbi:hypothetical protein P1X14_17880 [Sphingomonas sp. AOB5]|nr:hypothetical protein [Sphingomonas sp. AOB5]